MHQRECQSSMGEAGDDEGDEPMTGSDVHADASQPAVCWVSNCRRSMPSARS